MIIYLPRPNSDSNISDEVHTCMNTEYHGLRHRMSLTHVNARTIMVHCECTRVYQYGCNVHNGKEQSRIRSVSWLLA
jgi:hypothetical protein